MITIDGHISANEGNLPEFFPTFGKEFRKAWISIVGRQIGISLNEDEIGINGIDKFD